MDDFPLKPGDTGETAMLSLCAGGLLRTWTEESSQLWSVQDADFLRRVQGTGVIGRTLREERRFREAAVLFEDSGGFDPAATLFDDRGAGTVSRWRPTC